MEGAIPVEKKEEKDADSTASDTVLRGTKSEQRSQREASHNGALNVKAKGSGSVWDRLGKRNDKKLAVTVDNRPSYARDDSSDLENVKSRLPKSLRDRLGAKPR